MTFEELEQSIIEASRINTSIYKKRLTTLDHKKHAYGSVQPVNQQCSISTSGKIEDRFCFNEGLTNHELVNEISDLKQRNSLILSIFEYFYQNFNHIYQSKTNIILTFGLTDHSNGNIFLKIDQMNLHPRPVMPNYFCKLLKNYKILLDYIPEAVFQTERVFKIDHQKQSAMIKAPNEVIALWRFLCLHEKQFLFDFMNNSFPTDLLKSPEFIEKFKNSTIREHFDFQKTLKKCARIQ